MRVSEYKPKNDATGVPQEELDRVVKHMKDGSKKPAKIPRRLYHATRIRNFTSIREKGLLPHEIFGEIYFCEKERQALSFVQRPAIVFCVETNELDHEELFLSGDHKKIGKRNFEAFTYYKAIDPKFLNNWRKA